MSVTTDGRRMTSAVRAVPGISTTSTGSSFTPMPGDRVQTSVTTIERFIVDQEDRYPEATGELSNLLYDIALAAKIIAAAIRRAGLVNILGTRRRIETCRARSSRSSTSSPTRRSRTASITPAGSA